MDRAALLDKLWEASKSNVYISQEQFLSGLDGWDIQPVEIDGELTWITAQNGHEFHFQSMGTKRPMPRRIIRKFLQTIIDQYGYAQTRTPEDDARQRRFNEHFGFHLVGYDEFDAIYQMRILPMTKDAR